MSVRKLLVCSIVLALATVQGYAVEGGAVTIDTLAVDAYATSKGDSSGVDLMSEVSALSPALHWNILADLNYMNVNLDAGGSETSLGGALGTRYYITRYTSLDLLAHFDQYDVFGFKDVSTLSFGGKQTFTTPRLSGVTPYALSSIALRFKNYSPGVDTANESRNNADVMVRLGAGCDFMLTHTLAMCFQYEYVGITDAAHSSSNYDDASHISVSFKGYWDYNGAYDPKL